MALMDYVQSAVEKVFPSSRGSGLPRPASSGRRQGIGNAGVGEFEDEMIISKPAVIFHTSQAFLSFIAMCCFASVAAFQAHWGVGPSGLSGFAVFISVAGIILALFIMLVPVIDVKYGKLTRLARALAETRVSFILIGTGTVASLLVAFITTISAWTEAGCKNAKNDPHAKEKGDDFVNGLANWCTTKKAGAIFFWLEFVFWMASLILLIMHWRSGKSLNPRDPPFQPPIAAEGDGRYEELEEEDEESTYHHIPPASEQPYNPPVANPFSDVNRTSQVSAAPSSYVLPPVSGVGGFSTPQSNPSSIPVSRPSMDAYGAFSDPAPSGFGGAERPTSFGAASGLSDPTPGVSRTMQYADPYAAVRATIAGSAAPAYTPPSVNSGATSPVRPPTYTEYTGYR